MLVVSAEIDRYIANCLYYRPEKRKWKKQEGGQNKGVWCAGKIVVLVANVRKDVHGERHSSILPKKASSSSSARPRLRELALRKSSSSAKLSSSMSTSLSLL